MKPFVIGVKAFMRVVKEGIPFAIYVTPTSK